MVGCREDAEFIGEFDVYEELPDGWDFISEGSQRTVYISPDNVIYKVELPKAQGANELEFINLERIRKLGPLSGWDIPDAELYVIDRCKTVIAMEWVEGEFDTHCQSWKSNYPCDCGRFPCIAIEWEMATEIWGVHDMTEENIIVTPDGTRMLVDAAR